MRLEPMQSGSEACDLGNRCGRGVRKMDLSLQQCRPIHCLEGIQTTASIPIVHIPALHCLSIPRVYRHMMGHFEYPGRSVSMTQTSKL